MTLFMNEKDMNEMLASICPEGETYQGKAWGTLMSGTAEMLALGALSKCDCECALCQCGYRQRTGTCPLSSAWLFHSRFCLPPPA